MGNTPANTSTFIVQSLPDGEVSVTENPGTASERRIFTSIPVGEFAVFLNRCCDWFSEHGFAQGANREALLDDVESEIDTVTEVLALRTEQDQLRDGLCRFLSVIANDEGQTIPSSLKSVAWDLRKELRAIEYGQHAEAA